MKNKNNTPYILLFAAIIILAVVPSFLYANYKISHNKERVQISKVNKCSLVCIIKYTKSKIGDFTQHVYLITLDNETSFYWTLSKKDPLLTNSPIESVHEPWISVPTNIVYAMSSNGNNETLDVFGVAGKNDYGDRMNLMRSSTVKIIKNQDEINPEDLHDIAARSGGRITWGLDFHGKPIAIR